MVRFLDDNIDGLSGVKFETELTFSSVSFVFSCIFFMNFENTREKHIKKAAVQK